MLEDRKENYQLFVYAKTDKFREEKVRCKVYLPEKLIDPIELHFYPTEDQVYKLRNIFEFSIKGEIEDFSGIVRTRIQAEKVYSINLLSTHWGPKITENILVGEPTDLKVIHFISRDESNSIHKITGSFWLTPSILLRPAQSITQSWSGDVTVKTVRQFNFTLVNGLPLIFDNCYRYSKNKDGDTITFTELIARYKLEKADDVKQIDNDVLNFLDDFLLLVSFAERRSCICLGWETIDSNSFTKYYRRNLTIPTIRENHDYNETLIDIQKFADFIEKAYRKFNEIEPKEYIRQAIQYTICREGRTVENSFLTLYSALETLLYFCRKDPILPPRQWPQLCKDLRKWLKKHPFLNDDKEKRKLIYEKLPELNRVSFASAFKELCNSYSVNLEDLWPVLKKTEGPSLYEIRNKLVHGETFFNPLQQRALITAEKHLRWTVERLILSILGWDISASNVSKDFLPNMTCYIRWEADQQSFSR